MRWAIAVGGVGVIGAVVLIFFYLLWVVFPLFLPASVKSIGEHAMPGWAGNRAVFLAVEEQREVGLRLSGSGELAFFMAATGEPLQTLNLSRPGGSAPVLAAPAVEGQGLVGVATEAGDIKAQARWSLESLSAPAAH